MVFFCPTCGNLLMFDGSKSGGGQRFGCQTCPYVHGIKMGKKITLDTPLKRKTTDDILGGEAAWINVDKTEAVCPACMHKQAYFMQRQLRSADEPMTTFYRCCSCKNMWSE
ncbi:unnamed protein product [Phaeothamnion confervicola]